MMIEDEAAVYLADGFLRAAFDNLDRCGRDFDATKKFGGYCAARVFAAAKFVRAADELLLGLSGVVHSEILQALPDVRHRQYNVLQQFWRHINTSEWNGMRQADRIRSAENAFQLCKKGQE